MSIQFRTRSGGIGVDPTTLMGACCDALGNCTDTSLSLCPSDSDFYAGQLCSDNPCSYRFDSGFVYGVCCDEHGFCYITTEEGCGCRDGEWKGKDFDCLSSDCCEDSTAYLQACCMGNYIKGVSGDYSWSGVCKDLKPCECLNVGGVPRGPLSTCSEINSAGGCGVTGATAHGSCCLEGNCLSPDDKNYPNGYTAGDCSIINGLWGGSGSSCGDGSTFSSSWPCSWPTGSCCFGNHPFNGITYCSDGITCGDCLNEPPGGSGGAAWVSGSTCGTLTSVDGFFCVPPIDNKKGTCCIPEYFGVEDPDVKPFIVDYNCYVTSNSRCIALGGLWSNEQSSCDDIDCCEYYGDCGFGSNGACCQFNISSGEFIKCDNTTIYHCEQIAANNKDITTLFHEDEECNEETGYPCKDSIFVTDSCCIWQRDGSYIGCQNIGENDPCPPAENYVGIRFDQPCESPGFNCSVQEIGACCHELGCSFTSRGQCIELNGIFYSGLNCEYNCDTVPCCNKTSDVIIAGYNKENKTIKEYGTDRCLDSFDVSSQHLDRDFASDYLIDFGINNTESVYVNINDGRCEDCDCPYSRNRGSCCWHGKCIPAITQNECKILGGTFTGCDGLPFENVSDSWNINNPCVSSGCAEIRSSGISDCGEPEDCVGACCSGSECPTELQQGPGGSCTETELSNCTGCFYGCDTTCCPAGVRSVVDPTGACCMTDGTCLDTLHPDDCTALGGVYAGDDTLCADDSVCHQGICCMGDSCTEGVPKNDCCFAPAVWSSSTSCTDDPTCSVETYVCDDQGLIGACCAVDGTCSMTTQKICSSDNWLEGTLCVDNPCGSLCVDCETSVCPDCRPCCKHLDNGYFICEDLHPADCIADGGKPQYSGTSCDTSYEGDSTYTQGQVYCNYCGYTVHAFADGDITNLGAVCRACCEDSTHDCVDIEYGCCLTFETYQETVDFQEEGCHVRSTLPSNCGVSEDEYLPATWCSGCPCDAETGACCSPLCAAAGTESCDDNKTKEECAPCQEGEVECDNLNWSEDGHSVWMGPSTFCDDWVAGSGFGTSLACTADIAPCCYCKVDGSDGTPDTQPPDSCDVCNLQSSQPDCGYGPGQEPPPWRGSSCKNVGREDYSYPNMETHCIWSDNSGRIGVNPYNSYGKSCSHTTQDDYSCDACDADFLGKGACCDCHRSAHLDPHNTTTRPWPPLPGAGFGGPCEPDFFYEASCCYVTKEECDLLNKWGPILRDDGVTEGGIDCKANVLDDYLDSPNCPLWEGDPEGLVNYPECNSEYGVSHPDPNVSNACYTFFPKGDCTFGSYDFPDPDEELPIWYSGAFWNTRPCDMWQECNSYFEFDSYYYSKYGTPPYSTCHPGYFGQNNEGGMLHHWDVLPREWSTPWNHPYFSDTMNGVWGNFPEHIGTPLKNGAYGGIDYCVDRHPSCGIGCPECRTSNRENWFGWRNMGKGIMAGFGLRGRLESDYQGNGDCRHCPTFGSCCNPHTETCARWPMEQCLKLGGYYMGDVPCMNIGCVQMPTDGPGQDPDHYDAIHWNCADRSCSGDTWSEECGACDACAVIAAAFKNKRKIKYKPLLIGRTNTNDMSFSVPFFGFVDIENKPINVPDESLYSKSNNVQNNILYKIHDGRNEPLVEALPLPTDPTSYQYIQGYYNIKSHNNNNRFDWGMINGNDKVFEKYKNSITQLWLTRKYRTPDDVDLSNVFEPYYHSKVFFSELPNLNKLVINPARYGNGRNEYNDEYDWQQCTGMVGYYIGVYLSKDLEKREKRRNKIKTIVAADSSVDVICTPMQYFNASSLTKIETLHLNNNELYRLDIPKSNNIREIWVQDNKLGANSGTEWLARSGYPNAQEDFPMYKIPNIERLLLSDNEIKTLDTKNIKYNKLTSLFASNNKDLHNNKKLILNVPVLEYLDLSGCALGRGIELKNSVKLKQLILRDSTKLNQMEFSLGRNKEMTELNFLVITNTELPFINLGVSSQEEWGDVGEFGNYDEYGNAFLNLKHIDLSGNGKLKKIELPKPADAYSTSNKGHIEYLNISGTVIEDIDELFSHSVFTKPKSYPIGHILEVSARNISGTLSLDKYNEIMNLWNGSGRFIVLDVDIDK